MRWLRCGATPAAFYVDGTEVGKSDSILLSSRRIGDQISLVFTQAH
jgi:hypothetical protein